MILSTIIGIVIIALVVIVLYDIDQIRVRKEAEKQAEEERYRKEQAEKRKEEQKRIEGLFNIKLDSLVTSFGPCTSDILLGDNQYNYQDHMFLFEDTSTLLLRGEEIPFSKILGFSLNDDTTQITQNHTGYESVTKTSTGNMLGRAVVGGVLLGGVGAFAGASTAKKETTTKPTINKTKSMTLHHYIIYINIDDLRNPTREIDLGADTYKAQNIANLFNIIVQRNK